MSAPSVRAAPRIPGLRVTQGRVLRAEWTKFRTLRSTYITVFFAVLLGIGIAAISAAVTANHWPHATLRDRITFDPVATSLNGIYLAQLALGVLGVLLVTGEYSTGMIKASLTAVPKRLPVLWAKLAIYTAVTLIASFVISFASFVVGQALLASQHIQADFSTPHALRMVVGAALYLTVVGILALAIGSLTRNSAGGISAWVGVFFVVPPIFFALPESFSKHIAPYLPAEAGQSLWTRPELASLHPWAGFGVLCGWTAATVVAAAISLRRRDA
jgi:ABC-type transport system involved in multi-copper enzyme maturation permease subunit